MSLPGYIGGRIGRLRAAQARRKLRLASYVAIVLEILPWSKKRISLNAFLIFFLPSELLLLIFFCSNRQQITHGSLEISYVFLASLWFWIGPTLIWRYEGVILPRYWKCTRHVIPSRQAFFRYRARYRSELTRVNLWFLLLWTIGVSWTFFVSFDFIKGFGFSTMTDPWWLTWFLGVVLWGFISGLGFSACIRTFFICRDLAREDLIINPWHPDGRGGLGYVGKLLVHTTGSLASGAIFIPILFTLLRSMKDTSGTYSLAILIGFYAAAILLSFLIPAIIIHRRMETEKQKVLTALALKRSSSLDDVDTSEEMAQFFRQVIIRQDFRDANAMDAWPFQPGNLVPMFGSVILPILLFALDKLFGKLL